MVVPNNVLGPMDSAIFTVRPEHPDVSFAVLRRHYNGNVMGENHRPGRKQQEGLTHRNDSRVFLHKKVHPIDRPPTLDQWRPEVRHEVLLPDDADDRLIDARLLFEDYEAHAVPGQRDLLSHVKIMMRVRRWHHLWEDVRQFAKQEFVRKESMAVLMIMHVPQLSPPHLHLLIPCRRLTPTGWSDFVQELARDGGCKRVSDAWTAFKLTL